jgi:hypothetical protein
MALTRPDVPLVRALGACWEMFKFLFWRDYPDLQRNPEMRNILAEVHVESGKRRRFCTGKEALLRSSERPGSLRAQGLDT